MLEVKATVRVVERIWFGSDGYDDTYLVVPEIQVMAHSGWKKGDEVEVTIRLKERGDTNDSEINL